MERTILKVESRILNEDGSLPLRYSCLGKNINPPLEISNIPPSAKSLAVVLESYALDEPGYTHWLIWNLPVTRQIQENELRGIMGQNDFGFKGYWGPKYSKESPEFIFRVFAFDRLLNFKEPAVNKWEFYSSVISYGIGQGKLIIKLVGSKAPAMAHYARIY